jgi:hypothetical protein
MIMRPTYKGETTMKRWMYWTALIAVTAGEMLPDVAYNGHPNSTATALVGLLWWVAAIGRAMDARRSVLLWVIALPLAPIALALGLVILIPLLKGSGLLVYIILCAFIPQILLGCFPSVPESTPVPAE